MESDRPARRGVFVRAWRLAGAPGAAAARLSIWDRFPGVARAIVPVAVSLLVHGLILMILVGAALTLGRRGDAGSGGAEFVITLSDPAPARAPEPDAAGAGPAQAPVDAGAVSVLPELRGLADGPGPPALRSSAGGAGAPPRLKGGASFGTATFAGLGAKRAGSVVYAVDASGAMVASLPFVLRELERSVGALAPGQRFGVVLFRDRGGSVCDVFAPTGRAPALVPATLANKAALSEWLAAVRPSGRSNPIDGLRAGLAMKPDAVFLLSRSIRRTAGDAGAGVWDRPLSETMGEVDRLNPRDGRSGRRRVAIKCVQFLEEDPTGTMQAIGQEHGGGPGSYTVLTLEALEAR